MRLTPERLLEVLPKHWRLVDVAVELGLKRPETVTDACRRFGLGEARKLLCTPAEYGKRLTQSNQTYVHRPKDYASGGLPARIGATELPGPPKSIIVCPDVHRPFHDKKAYSLFLKVCHVTKPGTLVIIGDYIDCYAVSFHTKSPARRASLKDEIDDANEGLDELQALGFRRVVYCEGNHEFRLERFLARSAPELYGLVAIRDLLKIKERGWEWVPYQSWTRIGKIAFSHEVGHAGKTAGQRSLDAFGGNIVIGHSHRGSTSYGGTVDGENHVALNVGWLGDLDSIDYMHKSQARGWQHGFGWIDMHESGDADCKFVPIVNGRACVRGEWIGL